MAEAQRPFSYGGQAVIEGVMIRGRSHYGLAVRKADGTIAQHFEPLNTLFTGKIRRFPFVRGVIVLAETLTLGMKALQRSANLSVQGLTTKNAAPGQPTTEEDGEIPPVALALTIAVSLGLGIAIFFLLPLLLTRAVDSFVGSDLVSNLIEGALRLAILVAYVGGIGLLPDIKRVFAYHGAEHMAVHCHEAGLPLTIENVRKFGTPHPRCGTAFLLTVMLVSIVVFALLGRPSMEWRIISRIVMIPIIAGISYELIRFSGFHQNTLFGQVMAYPGLLLQRLTTRQPDDSQVEIAITSMKTTIAADEGQVYAPEFAPRPNFKEEFALANAAREEQQA